MQVRRVTKVVKGGKQMSFRAVVVVGNGQGTVGVGCAAAKEVPPRPSSPPANCSFHVLSCLTSML